MINKLLMDLILNERGFKFSLSTKIKKKKLILVHVRG